MPFKFDGYGNPQRPFPGYVGEFQLGPVRIRGEGAIRRSDGSVVSGGLISHTDNLRDRRYPNHSTTWQVVRSLGVNTTGDRRTLRLQVKVVSSNYTRICPAGTLGIIDLVDDNTRQANGQTSDSINTTMPVPPSTARDGGAACRTHVHGMNNTDVPWTAPPRGGAPNGGMWALVEIGGAADILAGTWEETVEGSGSSRFHFTPLGGGRYRFQQSGFGNASGTAVLTGRRVRVDWTCCGGSWTGYIEVDINPSDSRSASGISTITKGDRTGPAKTVWRKISD